MARKLFNALFVVSVLLLTACTDPYFYEMGLAPVDAEPTNFIPVGDGLVDVVDEDGNLIEAKVDHSFGIEAGEKQIRGGKTALDLKTTSILINGDGEYAVEYAVEGFKYFYNVAVNGYIMKYKGYDITPRGSIYVQIEELSNQIQEKPFKQNFTSKNSLVYGDIILDMDTQEIEVNEEEAYLEEVTLLKSEHVRFEREATITSNPTNNNKILIAKGVNRATFEEHWSNDSTATVVIDYALEYHFNISAPAEIVVNSSEIVDQTFEVVDGKVTIAGHEFKFTLANTNCASVEYKGTDYTDQVLKCSPAVKSVKVIDATSMEIFIYENNKEDYAIATMPLTITTPEAELVKTEWSYSHTNYIRNATVNGINIDVLCDNLITFIDFYNNNSQIQENVVYKVKNAFIVSGMSFEVANLNNVLNRTYNFVNGSVTIEGNNVSINLSSAAVVGNVMHNNTNYASQITPCVVEARTITFISQSEAVIRFYDNNANDYAEAVVEAEVSEQVTVREIRKTFQHIAFNNAIVSGNVIAIPCNNNATFVKVYSNNTEDNAVNVGYVWTNYFTVSIPEFYTHNMNGRTYYFNAGFANVEGQDVSVTYTRREVSDIYFEGTNYSGEAPVCSVEAVSITFREGFADITFREGNETVTVTVTVSYRTTETLQGTILAGWMTDSFMNQHQNYEGTYLHIMASVNGAYVIYSRRENTTAWTTTNLSATEGANLLNSGRAAAWVYNGSQYIMGSVTAIAREDVQDRWILEYYLLNNELAYRLGKNAETIMGGIYRHPVREVATNNNGIWELNNEVFVGSN